MTQVHPEVCGSSTVHKDNLSTHEEIKQTQVTFTILQKSGVIKVDKDVPKLSHTKYEYLKLDSDTKTLEWDKIKRWGLKEPNTLICVTGERETSDTPCDLRCLLNFALRADAWIIIGETNTDFKKRLWETRLEYGMLPSGRIPILDIVSLDRAASEKEVLKGETKYRVNTACFDLYHTHIVLIDNTSQEKSVSLEVEFCQRLLRGMNRDKSCLMIFLVLGGDLESVRNAVSISTPNIFHRGSGGDDDIAVGENGPRTETQGNTSTNHKVFPECKLDISISSASEVDKKLFQTLKNDKSCLMIFLVLGGDLKSVRNAVSISTPNIFHRGSGGDDDITVLENGPRTETQGNDINTSTNQKEVPECKLDIFIGSASEVDKKLFQTLKNAKIDDKELIKRAITWNNMDFAIKEEKKIKETIGFQLKKQDQLEILQFAIVYNRIQLVKDLIDNGVNVNEISELKTHLYTEHLYTKDEATEMVSFVKEWAERLKDASNDRKNKSKLPCQAAHFFFLWSLKINRMELARIFLKLHQEPIAAYLKAADVLKQLGKQNKTYYKEAKKFEKEGIDIVKKCYEQNEQRTLDLLNRKLKCWSESTCINIALTSRNKLFLSQPVCKRLMKKCWFGEIRKGSSYILIGVSMIIFPAIFCAVEFNDQTDDSHYIRSYATEKPEVSMWSKLKYFYTAPVVIFILNCLSHLAFLGLYSYVLVVVFSPNYHMTEGIVFFWVLTIIMEEIRQIYSGYTLSKWKEYFGNKWNWLDIAIIIDFSIGLALRFIPKSECFETSRVLFSLNLIFFFFRFLHTLSATRTLGPMLTMIWKMVGILIKFLFILMTFIAAYAIASEAILYPETQLSWKLLYYLPRRAYWHLYGELFLDDMEGQSSCTNDPAMYSNYAETRCPSELGKVVGPILMGIYVLMSNILLMNLLIALLSHEIQKVSVNAYDHWSFQRLNLILEYQSRPFLPPPFIIIIHVYRLIKLIKERISKTANKSSEYDEELPRWEYDKELTRWEYYKELARWERCMARRFVDSQDKTNTDSSKEGKEAKCKQSKIANQDAEVPLKDNENKDNKARNNITSEIQAISSGISKLTEEMSRFSRVIDMLKKSVDELKTQTARQIPPPAVYSPPDKSFLETHEFPQTSWIAEQTTSPPRMQEEINQMHRSEEMGRESGPGSSASHYHVLPPIQPDRTDSNV